VPTAAVVNTVVNHLAGTDVDPEPPRRRPIAPGALFRRGSDSR
jgi:hypothetical protein